MQVEEALRQIATAAESASSDVRVVNPEVGQVVRQGDIYIHRVPDGHRHGAHLEHRQLAVGTSMGARHIVAMDSPVSMFVGTMRPAWALGALLGPCVVATGSWKVNHPEHANCVLPAGLYQVTHQMDALTLQRVAD